MCSTGSPSPPLPGTPPLSKVSSTRPSSEQTCTIPPPNETYPKPEEMPESTEQLIGSPLETNIAALATFPPQQTLAMSPPENIETKSPQNTSNIEAPSDNNVAVR